VHTLCRREQSKVMAMKILCGDRRWDGNEVVKDSAESRLRGGMAQWAGSAMRGQLDEVDRAALRVRTATQRWKRRYLEALERADQRRCVARGEMTEA
jgi:hypothetical protein